MALLAKAIVDRTYYRRFWVREFEDGPRKLAWIDVMVLSVDLEAGTITVNVDGNEEVWTAKAWSLIQAKFPNARKEKR